MKPANLLVTRAPAGEVVKLSDFGLARTYEASGLTGDGGTPAYMPPEQVTDSRRARPAADQYAAAATMYHLPTGTGLYEEPNSVPEMFHRILADEPIPLRSGAEPLPGPSGPVIRRALVHDPADRFPDVRELLATLAGG